MHQGAWLVWVLGAGAVAISTNNPFYLVPLFAVAWVVHASCRREGPTARSFRVFAIFGVTAIFLRVALVFIDRVSPEAIAYAFLEGLRLGVLLALFGTFNSVTDPFRVLRLAPRRWHEPALAAALALSIAPRTMDAVGRVREAQRMRGIHVRRWRSLVALAIPVLETGMEEAVTLAESMDARGHGRGRRTRYRPERWSPWALGVAGVSALSAAVFVALAARGTGATAVSTYPLRWPEVSAVLLALCFAFVLPALRPPR